MDRLVAKRLGKILREERINQNISIRALAEYCAISHTWLVSIENGEKQPTEEIFKSLCKELYLENNLFEQTEKKEDIKNKFDIFFDCIYFQDMDKVEQQFQNLLLLKENKEHNIYEIDFELIKLIYYISSRKNNVSIQNSIDKIEQNKGLLFPDEIILFKLYKAAHYTDINLLNEAEVLLKEIEEATDNKKYLSLIYQQLGIVYSKNNKTALAVKYYLDAKIIFDNCLNYIRSLYTCSNIAIAYIYSEAYIEAIKACKECMIIAKRLSLNEVIMINAYNLSYIYMLIEEYEKVNEYVMISMKYGNPENGIYFHNAYAYYKLNKNKLCEYWIEEGRSKLLKSEVIMSYLYDYLDNQIKGNIEKSIELLRIVIDSKEFDASFDNQDRRFIIKELLGICKLVNRYDVLAEYYPKLC